MNKGLSSVLNASRWLAALLVLLHHVRHILLVDLREVRDSNLLVKGVYFWTGLGDEAVMVFFVVSGLLVGALTLEKWRLGGPAMADYFIHRFSRIYIVLIPALLLGLGFDRLGTGLFGGTPIYTHLNVANFLDAGTWFGNLAMLQNVAVHVLGSNGPLWSLAYEWWYYCIWAFGLGAWFYRGWRRWLCAGLALALAAIVPFKALLWMSIWLLGVAAFYYGRSAWRKPHPVMGMLVFLAVLFACRVNHNQDNETRHEALLPEFVRGFGLGLAYALALASCWRLERPLWFDGLHKTLAGFSYSLYLLHYPLLAAAITLADGFWGWGFARQPSWPAYAYSALLAGLAFLSSYGFALLTEAHTYRLVGRLRRVFLVGGR